MAKAKKNTGSKSNGNGKPSACLCGCGKKAPENKIFVQGHDMKLRSAVLKHAREEERRRFSNSQLKWAFNAYWMTPEIKKGLPKLRSSK